jgi:hypothetical protein
LPSQDVVVGKVLKAYAFLSNMDSILVRIVDDSKAHKETKLVTAVLGAFKTDSKA